MPREHGESGEFVETITHADVLEVFDEVRGPVVLSADVADTLGCSRETARRKLEELYERGTLDRRKVARRVVYWPATRDESGRERGESAVEEREDPTPAPDPSPHTTAGDSPVDIDSLSFKRDLTDSRRKALAAWHHHVRDTDGGVTKSDFESWWSDDRAERTGYNSGSFWEAFAKASMKESDKFDKPNARTYRWVGDDGEV